MYDENGNIIEGINNEEIVLPEEEKDNGEEGFTNDFGFEEERKAKRERKGILKPVLITALCAAVAGAVFAGANDLTGRSIYSLRNSIRTTQENLQSIDATEVPELRYSEFDKNMSVESIAEACLPSVVSITNKGVSEVMTFFGNFQQESLSSGSGIIIGENYSELLIVTNYHVIADSKELTVVFFHDEEDEGVDDASYMNIAKVKGYDADKDIAVIAVNLNEINPETKNRISIATIGNSKDVKLGSGVVAIGNALGYGQSITHGIISAIGREATIQNSDGKAITNKYIQTDAGINEGNSGGALLNMKGELIGINSAKIVSTGVEAMGYAIPISDVESLISELMSIETRDVVDEKDRGYLGIYGSDVTSQASQMYNIPIGVFVQDIIDDSPADKSDLEEGDVIVKMDKFTITNMESLQNRLTYYKAGETITLNVKRQVGRNFEDVTVKVTLGTRDAAGVE